jgi:hypothetical protein
MRYAAFNACSAASTPPCRPEVLDGPTVAMKDVRNVSADFRLPLLGVSELALKHSVKGGELRERKGSLLTRRASSLRQTAA